MPYLLLAVVLLGGCSELTPLTEKQPAPPSTPPTSRSMAATPSLPVSPAVSPAVSLSPSPSCPAGGLRAEAGPGDAASGLRILDVYLVNCGRTVQHVTGYPDLRLLDDQRRPVVVQVLHGVTAITGAIPEYAKPPRRVTLTPGQRATAVLAWRNTYDDITNPPVSAAYLMIAPDPEPITPRAPVDLGSTGRIGVSAWQPS